MGEKCFCDIIEWKAAGVKYYQATFLTQLSKFPFVVDILNKSAMVDAIEKFVREVGVPTVLISDNAKDINKSQKFTQNSYYQ